MLESALLSRRSHRPPPSLTLWETVSLPLSRVHEICGTARRTFALRIAARREAPLIWIWSPHSAAPLNPQGMAEWIDPGQVLFVETKRPMDTLWSMEEALRSGAAPVVVADVAAPPEITPIRRLHLAAETGAQAGLGPPIGLILTPGTGGAPGIETRWCCDAAHEPRQRGWRLERLRARMQPPRTWKLNDDGLAPWQSASAEGADTPPHRTPHGAASRPPS